jgi:hypothetical protein
VAPPIVQPPPPVQPVEPEGETDDVESGLARLQTKNAAGLSRLKTSRRAPPKLKDANLVDEKKEVKSAQPKNLIMEGGEANDDRLADFLIVLSFLSFVVLFFLK